MGRRTRGAEGEREPEMANCLFLTAQQLHLAPPVTRRKRDVGGGGGENEKENQQKKKTSHIHHGNCVGALGAQAAGRR